MASVLNRPTTHLLIKAFGHLSPLTLAQLQEIFFERRYRAGEAIFLQGDAAKSIYVVVEGRVKIDRVTPDGNHCILCMRGQNETFCPVPLLDQGRQLGTAWALTDVTLLSADINEFRRVAAECPQLLAVVQHGCLLEVRRLLGRMEMYAFRSVRERVASMLLEESRRRGFMDKPANELRMTQQDLAGLVGASRESVSRTLSKMEQEGILQTKRGRIIILDREKLRAIVAP
ncbi:MAG TPA: Crp/Fnr family transcriptional regulator [Anaerolineae bacterium]|nr:Crp/Fnr family transcriptional regulator [Anaerolineae bacterium]